MTQARIGPDKAGRVVFVDGGRVVDGPTNGEPSWTLACEDASILPGRVNAHTHIYSGLAPVGMPAPNPPPTNFLEILERVWWRLDRALDEDTLRAAARLYIAEALLAGTTTLIDHHESPNFIDGSLDVLAAACDELGIRALLSYGATERNGGRPEAGRGLDECERFLQANQSPRVVGAIGLHAGFTVSDEAIREAGDLCREQDAVLHVHVAEDMEDVADAHRRGYEGPLERLIDLDALPFGSVLAHGVHLNARQVRLAESHGAWLVQNPRSNEGNGVGYAVSLNHSDHVALGTDGWQADMRAESDALYRLGAEEGEEPASLDARIVAGHFLVAQRFGAESDPWAPGALADFEIADDDGKPVHVVVEGEVVVRDGALVNGDLAEIQEQAVAAAGVLWARLPD